MPTVRMPMALAVAATTGAAPLPVPPPMPACSSSSVLGTGQEHAVAAALATLQQHRAYRGQVLTGAIGTGLLPACNSIRVPSKQIRDPPALNRTFDCNEAYGRRARGAWAMCNTFTAALWDLRCRPMQSSRLQASAPYMQQPPCATVVTGRPVSVKQHSP